MESFDWDADGVAHYEDDGGDGDCGIDALSGSEWIAFTDDCSYDASDDGDTATLEETIDTSPLKDEADGNSGDWEIAYRAQVDLDCEDSADVQIRLDGNDDWNTTNGGFECGDNEGLDDRWDQYNHVDHSDADDFRTLDGDGNWVETSQYPDDLELRFLLGVSQGGATGFFLDDVAFAGSSD
jgi:hypothetical protein